MSNHNPGSDMDDRITQIFHNKFSNIGKEVRPTQRKIIGSVLEGKNTLGLMPTGAGKSLCYWIAGIASGGVTLVIFPLTALMDEQAQKLASQGCKVFTLHSGIDSRLQYQELINLYNQRESPEFIFLSPERLATDGFLEFVLQSIRERIKLVVVDEAHCISQWGLDFRPFYKEIPHFLHNIFGENPIPVVLCLTATVNPKDREQICADFHIEDRHVIRHDMLLRPSINIRIIKVPNEDAKDEQFWALLEEHKNEKVLVYLDRRRGKRSTEELCEKAQSRGFRAAYFHADMTSDEKLEIINKFKSGELLTVFATSAFGMGIDIPDIRGVVHYLLTESTEQYYQQIGRVGRDNKPSWAVLFYSEKNIEVRKNWFIKKSFPTRDHVQRSFAILTDYKTGRLTFKYFDEGDDTQSAYHYLVRSRVITPICKGVSSLSTFQPTRGVSLPGFEAYRSATRTGLLVLTAQRTGQTEIGILRNIYGWLAEGKLKATHAPEKCLVIEVLSSILPEDLLDAIMEDVKEKETYRISLFDEFVRILESYTNTFEFHQRIGEYLGIDKFSRGRIHETLSGDYVRSKSEVIIANILYQGGIPFSYELPLTTPDGAYFLPDFTINWKGKTYYWEHLGLLDHEDYEMEWEFKKRFYEQHFPKQLITTQESSTLSQEAKLIIGSHFDVEAVDEETS